MQGKRGSQNVAYLTLRLVVETFSSVNRNRLLYHFQIFFLIFFFFTSSFSPYSPLFYKELCSLCKFNISRKERKREMCQKKLKKAGTRVSLRCCLPRANYLNQYDPLRNSSRSCKRYKSQAKIFFFKEKKNGKFYILPSRTRRRPNGNRSAIFSRPQKYVIYLYLFLRQENL